MTNSHISQVRGWKLPRVILIMSLLVISSFWAPKAYAASTQVIYYFNGYDPGQAWPVDQDGNGPGNMVDDDEWTHSGDGFANPADRTQLCNSNTCPGTDLGAITKVEMRGKIDVYGSGGFLYLTPKFSGGNGTTRLFQNIYEPQGGLTSWFDITSDPNAPSTWNWTHVKNVDVWVRGVHTVPNHDESVYKIWIRVTYTIENVDTYESSYSTLKDEYVFPGDTVYAKAMGLTQGEAWLPGWEKRVRITIDQGDVSDSLADFPVLIHLSTSSGQGPDDVSFVFDELQNDGNRKKIAVTTGDGIEECSVEIEKWDDANEQAWLWVKVPGISNTAGTVLYLYYDASHADNTNYIGDPGSLPAKRIWDKFTSYQIDYGGVWHLDEAVSDGTPGGQKDSSPNNNHGTPRNFQDGGGGATGTTGKIDGADKFAGDDDYVTVSSPTRVSPTDRLTVSAWIKISGAISYNGEIVTRGDSYGLRVWTDGRVLFYKYVGSSQWVNMAPSGVNVIDNAYHHIVGVHSTSSGMKLYIDGIEVDSNDNKTAINYGLGGTLEIGRHGNGSPNYNFSGMIDEVRVQNIARTVAWIKASYENERDHFVDYGSEEVVGGGVASWLSGWEKRMKMTIDRADISSGLTNFPVLIYLSSSSGIYRDSVVGVFNEVGSNSKKIAVTTSDGTTQCYVEIEKWDSGSNKAWLWVNVSSVSSTADTVLYLYYDNSKADNTNYVGDQGSTPAQKVWDSSFKGVWHLKEDPSGTAPQMKDSTSNAKHGTTSNMVSGDQQSGKIDGSLNFGGTNQYVQTTSADSKTGNALTWECWFKADTTAFAHHLMWEGYNSVDSNGWGETWYIQEMHISLGDYQGSTSYNNRLCFFFGDVDIGVDSGAIDAYTSFSDTASWHHVAAVVSNISTSPSATLYLDGASVASDTGTTARTGRGNWDTNLRFARPGTATRYYDGLLDEVRVSITNRNAAWIKASYESGRDHLIDYGSEETRYDVKYYSDWLGTPVLEGSQSNVSESVRGEWRSSYALQAGDPTGTWGVRVYEAGTVTLRASCIFTVKPKVPEFPFGVIVPLASGFSIYLTLRKNRKRREALKDL